MGLRARKLTAQQAAQIWEDFYEEYGVDQMIASYGWESPTSRQRRKGETVWAFYDTPGDFTEQRVGWGACKLNTNDPDEVTAVLVVGVFHDWQRRGYRLAILDWMAEWAKGRGAKYAEIIVFAENEDNYARHHREAASEQSPWVWAGDHWYPDQYSVFVRSLEPEPEEVVHVGE